MLKHLRLESFKSFADADARFGPLTLLVGANASGKTNVLEALRLLEALLGKLSPLHEALRDTGVVRGGAREIARNGSDIFTLQSTWQTRGGRDVEHTLTGAIRPDLEVRSEELRDPKDPSVWLRLKALGAPLAQTDGTPAGPTGSLEWPGPPHTDPAPSPMAAATSTRQSAIWPVFSLIADSPPRRLAQDLSETLRTVRFLDIAPSRMREYVPLETADLQEDGANLSAVLFRLCQDQERKQRLLDWLCALCAPELADIEFSHADEGSVMLRLVEKDGIKVSARSLSDGTLRFLGELIALRSAPPGSVVLIEELGRDVHPHRMHLLVEYLESVTEERGIQVIATTHSPDVLAALGPRSREDAIVLGRVPERAGTVMRRLGDLPHFEEVVARRGLDELFTTGWLEQAL